MHISLDPAEKDRFIEVGNTRHIKNKTSVLKAGQVCRSIYFVTKGCLRINYTDIDGDEHTVSFFPENWWSTDIASFSAQKTSLFSIEAIENTDAFYVTFEALERLYSQIPKFEKFFRILTQNGYDIQQRRIFHIFQNRLWNVTSYFKNSTRNLNREYHKSILLLMLALHLFSLAG